MTTLIHADIFFFISSIGFVLIFGVLFVGLYYVVGILKNVRKISTKLENDVQDISSDAKDFIHDLRKSMVYRMIFGKGRTPKK